jgi:hypothetical protein
VKSRLVPLAFAYLLAAGLIAPTALLAVDDASEQQSPEDTTGQAPDETSTLLTFLGLGLLGLGRLVHRQATREQL